MTKTDTVEKENNKLLVNYIYSLSKEIYNSKADIQNHIINSNRENPVRTSYIRIEAEAIKNRAEVIIDICDNIDNINRKQFENIDNLEERRKAIEDLAIFFS